MFMYLRKDADGYIRTYGRTVQPYEIKCCYSIYSTTEGDGCQ